MAWGAIIGAAATLYSASQSRKHARAQTRFQANREDDAIQRRAADMKEAGINPILSVPQGAASSAGSQMGQSHDAGQAIAAGLSSGAQTIRARAEVAKIEEEIKSIPVARELTQEQIAKVSEEVLVLRQQAIKLGAEADNLYTRAQQIDYQNISAAQRAEFYQSHPMLQKIRATANAVGIEGRDVLSIVRLVLGRGSLFRGRKPR